MFETLIVHAFSLLTGGAGGAILRLLPEGLNLIKQKMANGHELDMMDKQLLIQKEIGSQKLEEVRVVGATQVEVAQIKGTVESTATTGIKFVDTLNGSVRPVITYWLFGLYAAAKTLIIIMSWGSPFAVIIPIMWTPTDSSMLMGLLSFWFLGRVIDKR